MIVLVGFMGSGKSTVGRLVATRLGLPFHDTDAIIQRRTGRMIKDIFMMDGEPAFRELESEVVTEVLSGDEAVVSLGGGAVNDPATRVALGWATVVYLETSYRTAMKRVGHDPGRPMLTVRDPKALFEERRDVYEHLAHNRVQTDDKTAIAVADEIAAVLSGVPPERGGLKRIVVDASSGPYTVTVGRGVLDRGGEFVPDQPDAERAFVLTHPHLEQPAEGFLGSLSSRFEVHVLPVPEGETAKSLEMASSLYARLFDLGAHRNDLVIGLGGGVITDIAGFIASTYNRGMPLIQVPTTLLGQVDAAIGGKTGVNLPGGKNLIGTFKQPLAVLCDVATLKTLSERELRSGLAEVIKYGLIADPDLLELISKRIDQIVRREDDELMIDVVASCVGIKADVVSDDERERGRRAILNYGHTFGHAIETVAGHGEMLHGEAISLGMVAAAYLGRELGMIDEPLLALHRDVLEAAGLPTRGTFDVEALERAWARDKKYRRGVRFVLLREVGQPEFGIEASRDAVARAVGRLAR